MMNEQQMQQQAYQQGIEWNDYDGNQLDARMWESDSESEEMNI